MTFPNHNRCAAAWVIVLATAALALADAPAPPESPEREQSKAAKVAKVAAKAGSDHVVRVEIVGMDDIDAVFQGAFERMMHATVGRVDRDGTNWKDPNRIFFALAPVPDVEAFAKRLDFGKATVDAAARRIEVRLPADAKLEPIWIERRAPDGDWSAKSLAELKPADSGPAGRAKHSVYAADSATYFVSHYDLPREKLKLRWQPLLADAVAALVKEQGLTVVAERDVREAGIGQSGRELVTKSADGQATAWRVFASLHNRRVYTVGVATDDESQIVAFDTQNFLGGFRIIKRGRETGT